MRTLQDLVPPLVLCEEIPEGEFDWSVLVWAKTGNSFSVIPRSQAIPQDIVCPAPTFQETWMVVEDDMDYEPGMRIECTSLRLWLRLHGRNWRK